MEAPRAPYPLPSSEDAARSQLSATQRSVPTRSQLCRLPDLELPDSRAVSNKVLLFASHPVVYSSPKARDTWRHFWLPQSAEGGRRGWCSWHLVGRGCAPCVLRTAPTRSQPAPKSVDGHLGKGMSTSHVVTLPASHSAPSGASAGLCHARRAVPSSSITTCPAVDTSSWGGHRHPSTGPGCGNAGSHPLVPALPPRPRDLHESLPPSWPSFTRWNQEGVS